MASLNLAIPDKFDFSNPGTWPQWKKRMERYMTVTGFSTKKDNEKMDFLMYIMGEESEEISLQFEKPPTTFQEMLQSFEDYFIPRRNVIFERFKFNSRVQKTGETIDSFISAFHAMAEHCDYGTLKEQLIRDRIVVGMLDSRTSEKLQLQSTLTLKDAITMARQAEMQGKQNAIIRQEQTETQIAHIQKGTSSIRLQQRFSQEKMQRSNQKHVNIAAEINIQRRNVRQRIQNARIA